MASSFNIVMYFSPGLNIVKVFKQKNRELISIAGSFIGLFNCGAWLAFGLRDVSTNLPIVVANGSGLGLCFIQIILYYSLGAPKKESKVDIEENNNEILLKQSSQRSHKGSDDYFKGFI